MALLSALLDQVLSRRPLLLYGAAWTALLTTTVSVASFSPELAFMSAVSSLSTFTRECGGPNLEDMVRVPVDLPRVVVCLPAHLFLRSRVNLVVLPVFAAIIVAMSALVVKALDSSEEDEGHTI